MKRFKLYNDDNLEKLKTIPPNSVDSVVTDPPYGLKFMNNKWDHNVPSVEFWREVYRVLKPGGHVLSFGGTRTYHRMVINIEDAGFEIRDQIQWLYGSGFPKSHNIGKAVDKKLGNERDEIGVKENYQDKRGNGHTSVYEDAKPRIDIPITKGYSKWEGWGTGLKPANEPICLARKPISEKTITDNVLKWGTGGINIDGCRVGSEIITTNVNKGPGKNGIYGNYKGIDKPTTNEGRFPANVILECTCDEVIHTNPDCPCSMLDEQSGQSKTNIKKGEIDRDAGVFIDENGERKTGHKKKVYPNTINDSGGASRYFQQIKHTNPDCPCSMLDEQSGFLKSGEVKPHHKKNKTANGYQGNCYGKFKNEDTSLSGYGDGGGASRFFYCAKVSKKERNLGLDDFEEKESSSLKKQNRKCKKCGFWENKGAGNGVDFCKCEEPVFEDRTFIHKVKNNHPTTKPVKLMRYLCRLITPPNGIVLDPFMGSGSTGIAALLEGFRFCGMEMDENYFKIAEARIKNYEKYNEIKN